MHVPCHLVQNTWYDCHVLIFGWDSLMPFLGERVYMDTIQVFFWQCSAKMIFLFALYTELNIWYTVKQHIISFFILQIVWLLMSDKLKKTFLFWLRWNLLQPCVLLVQLFVLSTSLFLLYIEEGLTRFLFLLCW